MLRTLRNKSSLNLPRIRPSAAICQVLTDRKAIEELIDLIALGEPKLADIGDAHPRDVSAFEDDPARRRRNLAGQHLEECGLACAVRPDDAAHFTVIDDEIDIAVGHQTAIALGEAGRLQNRSRGSVGGWLHPDDVLLGSRCGRCGSRYGRLRCCPSAPRQPIEIDDGADNSSPQEADEKHEHDPEHQLPRRPEMERVLEEITR